MKLEKKKQLAARVLKVGREKICFDQDKLAELKEAITKQDIKDLFKAGAIKIKDFKGRKVFKKRTTRKLGGKIKKNTKDKKQEYVKITRKLRRYAKELKKQRKIENKFYHELRKKIKARAFKSKAQLKEYLKENER